MDRRTYRSIVAGGWRWLPSLALTVSTGAQAPAEIQQAVDAAYAKFRTLKEGKNADYIPALAKVDPEPVRHRRGHCRTARSTPPAT